MAAVLDVRDFFFVLCWNNAVCQVRHVRNSMQDSGFLLELVKCLWPLTLFVPSLEDPVTWQWWHVKGTATGEC